MLQVTELNRDEAINLLEQLPIKNLNIVRPLVEWLRNLPEIEEPENEVKKEEGKSPQKPEVEKDARKKTGS